MKLLYAFIALWIFVPKAYAGAQDDAVAFCPVLPPDAALRWTLTLGVDFQICSGSLQGSSEVAFGVYFGNWPGFNRKNAVVIGNGTIGGLEVTWYQHIPINGEVRLDRDTLIHANPNRPDAVFHVWVLANSDKQLQERLDLLSRMRFRY
jgi:hypothetical protein